MKNAMLILLLAFFGIPSFAQTYDKVSGALRSMHVENAKTELDKVLADPNLNEKELK